MLITTDFLLKCRGKANNDLFLDVEFIAKFDANFPNGCDLDHFWSMGNEMRGVKVEMVCDVAVPEAIYAACALATLRMADIAWEEGLISFDSRYVDRKYAKEIIKEMERGVSERDKALENQFLSQKDRDELGKSRDLLRDLRKCCLFCLYPTYSAQDTQSFLMDVWTLAMDMGEEEYISKTTKSLVKLYGERSVIPPVCHRNAADRGDLPN